jgi:hypothetical protein
MRCTMGRPQMPTDCDADTQTGTRNDLAQKTGLTLKDDTKRALANPLADLVVDADNVT